ncbi:hypothetical protein FF1_005447 [Malus domestica]
MLEGGANFVAASSESPPNPTCCTWCAHPEQVGLRSRHRLLPPQRLASLELQTTAVKRLAGREARSTIFSVRLRPCSAPCKFPSPSSKFIQK